MNLHRELDVEVAEFVMELQLCYTPSSKYGDWLYGSGFREDKYVVPNYPTDIKAAWGVVEKIRHSLGLIKIDICKSTCSCEISIFDDEYLMSFVVKETTPLAICLTALEVKGRDINKYKELTT